MPVVSVSSTTDLVAISAQLSTGQSCKSGDLNMLAVGAKLARDTGDAVLLLHR
jgi:hypothetical protein